MNASPQSLWPFHVAGTIAREEGGTIKVGIKGEETATEEVEGAITTNMTTSIHLLGVGLTTTDTTMAEIGTAMAQALEGILGEATGAAEGSNQGEEEAGGTATEEARYLSVLHGNVTY